MTKRNSRLADYGLLTYPGQPDYCGKASLLAWARVWADLDHNTYRSEVRVKRAGEAQGDSVRVSAGGSYESSPRLSSDGQSILFLSNATGTVQLYRADRKGEDAPAFTEPVCLTHMRYDVHDPLWSPDGQRIAFLCDCEPDLDETLLYQELNAQEKSEEEEAKSRRPVAITDFGYKADEDKGFTEIRTSHLFLWEAETRKVRKLSDGDRDHVMPAWSPDGKKILIASNRERPREESIGMDLYQVETETGKLERLSQENWIAFYPAPFWPRYTPDGSRVVFGALFPDISGNMPLTRLFQMQTEPGAEEKSIWPENAPCHEATCFLYNGESMAQGYEKGQISEDGKALYFISGWKGEVNLYRAALEGDPEIIQVTRGHHYYSSLGEPHGGRAVALKGDFTHPPRIVLVDLESGNETVEVDENPWLADVAVEEPEEMWIDTLDGKGRVQGWVLPPQNREPGKKYPAVLYIHGGPTPFYGYAMTYEHEAIAGAGMGVIFCNPRGSSCYGSAHESNAAATDGTAMYDLLQFVREACARSDFIDPTRLGVTGGSYGGYMTNWLVGHTKVFRAAVTQRSIASELIEYASSDMVASSQDYSSMADFLAHEVEISPVAYAEEIDIPFLILHALGDMRCPVEEAHQLFTAVKDIHPDLPVRMVLFPGENHEMTNHGRIQSRLRHYQETIDWFIKYL